MTFAQRQQKTVVNNSSIVDSISQQHMAIKLTTLFSYLFSERDLVSRSLSGSLLVYFLGTSQFVSLQIHRPLTVTRQKQSTFWPRALVSLLMVWRGIPIAEAVNVESAGRLPILF